MAVENLGASFSIDITNLKAGLAQANRLIRESESEFKAAAAGMDDWSSSQEGLEAKIKSLSSITELQRKKVGALTLEYERMISEGLDPASKEAVDLRTKINNETAALNKSESALASAKQALDDFGKTSDKAGKDVDKVGDAAKDAGGGLEGLKGAAGVAAGAVAAVGAACAAAVGSFFGLAESTRESRTAMGKLETAFAEVGMSAQAAENTFTELYGVLGDEGRATEAAQQLAQYANTEEELAEQTRLLTGVFATYGDSIPTEGLAEGVAATIAMGETQGVLADALEWQGVNLDSFNESLAACADEQEREALITETLNGLYGEAADKYREVNADVIAAQEAQAGLTQAMNDLGAIAEPVMTTLKTLAADLLTTISPFVGLMGEGLQGALNGTAYATEKIASGLSGLLTVLVEKLVAMLPTVISTLVSVLSTIVPLLVSTLSTQLPLIISAIMGFLPQLLTVLAEQLPVILQAVISGFSQIVSMLGLMLPTLIPIVIAAVISLAETLIDNIDLLIDAGIDLVIGLADGLLSALPFLIEKAPVLIEKLYSAIARNLPKLLQMGVELVLKLGAGLIKAVPQLVSKIPQIVSAILGGLSEAASGVFDVGKDIVRGLWDGIKDMGGWIADKLEGFGESVLGSIKSFFGIKSPSRVMADVVGKNLALGIGAGFEDEIDGVNKKITGSVDVIAGGGISPHINSTSAGAAGKSISINQVNHYAQAHSRFELWQSRKDIAAAVRLASVT